MSFKTFTHTHTHEKKRKNRITHVYNGTPASFLNQNTMCRVSSPGGVMSHGNSAGFPSTTLILTSGTANENRRIVRLKGLRFPLPVGRPEFSISLRSNWIRARTERGQSSVSAKAEPGESRWANIRPVFFDSENPDIRMQAQSNGRGMMLGERYVKACAPWYRIKRSVYEIRFSSDCP